MKEKGKEKSLDVEVEAEEIEEENLSNPEEPISSYMLNDKEVLSLKNTVIFISNSELDGFREGDGDLMDKLVAKLNDIGINTIRVIENQKSIPDDKLVLLDKKQIITLGDHV